MKGQFTKIKDLLLLDGLNIYNAIGLISIWMFGLVGFSAWLTGLLISRPLKSK